MKKIGRVVDDVIFFLFFHLNIKIVSSYTSCWDGGHAFDQACFFVAGADDLDPASLRGDMLLR